MKKAFIFFLSVVSAVAIILLIGNILHSINEKNEDKNVDTTIDWKTTFEENGFSNDEISEYEVILNNVGVTDFHDVEIFENGRMHIVKGKIYDSDDCFLHITLEDRKIIVAYLSMPDIESKPYLNWRGAIKFRHEQTWKCVDLYYDVEGGYVAKLDWENKMLSPFYE